MGFQGAAGLVEADIATLKKYFCKKCWRFEKVLRGLKKILIMETKTKKTITLAESNRRDQEKAQEKAKMLAAAVSAIVRNQSTLTIKKLV